MANDIGIRIGVDGEKEFKTALSAINAQLKNLSSEMKATVTSMTGMDSAESRSAKKADILGRSIEATKQKIDMIRAAYDRAKEKLDSLGGALEQAKQEFGENSAEALKAQNAYNRQAAAVNHLGTQLNNAQSDLNRMESELQDVEDAADDTADAFEDAGDSALTFGDVLKANVLGQAIIEGVKQLASAVKSMAGEFIESAAAVKAESSQFEQTFGDMGSTASAAIERVASSSGILDTRLNTLGAQIYAFTRSSGGDATESMDLMETALQATADAAAYYDRSLEDTAESLQSFLKGNYANDAALGLSCTETTRNAAATELFGKKFSKLTEIQKQQTLLKMVTDSQKLSGAMGQAAREADGWENVQGNLNEAWRQFMAAAGTPFLDNLVPIVQQLTGKLQEMTQSIDWEAFSAAVTGAFQWLIDNGETILSVAVGIGAAFVTWNVANMITGLVGAWNAYKVATEGATVAQWLLNAAQNANPVGIVIAAVAGLVAALVTLWHTNEGFRNAVIGIWENIKQAFSSAWTAIKGVWDQVKPFFSGIWNGIKTVFSAVKPYLSAAFSGAWSAIKAVWSTVTGFFSMIWNTIKGIFSAVKAVLSGDFEGAWNAIKSVWSGVTSFFSGIWQQIKGVFSGAFSAFLEIGRNIVNGIKQGFSNAWGAFASWVKSKFDGLVGSVKGLLGIHSPSRVFRDQIGKMLMLGLAEGIQNGIGTVESALHDTQNAILKVADELNRRLVEKESELSDAIKAEGLDEVTKAALEEQLQAVQAFRREYEQALSDLQSKQDSMAEKLKSYGDLLTTVQSESGSFLELSDLQSDIDAIGRYGEALEQLKQRGVSDTLMAEIIGMDVDDATAYTEKLLAMTDEQYSEYMALWEQKQKAAADVAQRFYSDEMTSLVNEYVSKVPDALGIMKDDLYQVGQLAAKGLAQGILSQKSAVVSAARSVAAAARAALRSAEGIHSPAKKWAVLGDYMAQGIGVGFTRRMDTVAREITASIPSVDAYTARERASAGMVNGIVSGLSAVMGSGSTQPITLQVNMDGKTIAQTIFDPLKDVSRQRGVALG